MSEEVKKVVFSIWESEVGGITLKRGPDAPTLGDGPEDLDAVKIKEFEAGSWNEACRVRNDHYGWEWYEPHDGWEAIP